MRNTPVNKAPIEKFIRKNPTASYQDFSKANPGVTVSDCYYYTLRRKMTGMARDSRKKSNTYVRLFLTEAKEVSKQAKNLLQKFIDAMNITHGSKMEMIEFGEPSQLEIRELKNF